MIGILPLIYIYLAISIWITYSCFLATETSPIVLVFTEKVPRFLLSLISRIFGDRAVSLIHGISEKFLVILYLVVVLGSWSIMFTYGYEFISHSSHVDDRHKTSGYVVFVICMWSWRKAGTTSPGYITERNIPKYDNYPYDNLLYVNKKCPTLGFRKLARSKYDRFTKKHVARFDHYCGWIDNAVGEENYRFFLLFLFIHIAMCVYGTIVTFHLLRGEVRDRDLFNAIFFNAETGEEVEADFWVIAHYIFMRHFQLCAVFLLMGVMSVVLGLFFLFHLFIASRGMTTNEYYKWKQVHKWYKKEKDKFLKAVKEGKVSNNNQKSDSGQAKNTEKSSLAAANISDGDVGCVGPVQNRNVNIGEIPQEESVVDSNKDEDSHEIMDPGPRPKNIYDLGVVENLREVLFPRSLRRKSVDNTSCFVGKTKNV
jgi:Uncharacterized protein containing DHHC-type Zn finger